MNQSRNDSQGNASILIQALLQTDQHEHIQGRATKPKSKRAVSLLDDRKQDEAIEDSELFKLALSDASHVQTANVIQSAALDEVGDLDTFAQKTNGLEKPIVVVKPSPLRNFIYFVIGTIVGALGLLIYAWNREAITSFVINTIDWIKTFV